jgi:dihydrolipoamide dehydrogenase
MANKIRVPELGDSVTSATLGRWLKKVGEPVGAGEVVAEIETDKATVEVPAPVTGLIIEITVHEGATVTAGLVLGAISEHAAAITVAKAPEIGVVSASSSPEAYDVIVIGSGPGGYVCAIRAAQLGLKVAVVEKQRTYGGTCLNVGCIPSKVLLFASEMFAEAGRHFATLGIEVGQPALNLTAMMAHKDETVAASVTGIAYLFHKNKVDTYRGVGRIAATGTVEVTAEDGGRRVLATKHIVIATGSETSTLKGIDVDGERIVTSDTAIAFPAVPGRLLIAGAGAVGLELGSVWSRFGSRVTVVEVLDHILAGIDREIAGHFARLLQEQGITLKLGSKVSGIERNGEHIKVTIEPTAGGQTETIEVDTVPAASGRRAYTAGLGLAEIGVAQDKHGRVKADRHYRTNVDGIWAIGGVIAGPMLAHKASDEGIAVAEIIAGRPGSVNYDAIPSVVYTNPEVASVGKTEDELRAAGLLYTAGKYPFSANGRARAMLKTDGFVKILAEKATGYVLGAHILGPAAGELIAELTLLIQSRGTVEELARTCHAHPTLSEAVREAALGAMGRSIDI